MIGDIMRDDYKDDCHKIGLKAPIWDDSSRLKFSSKKSSYANSPTFDFMRGEIIVK